MTIGLVGRKCGMTPIFTDAGITVPVTVLEALPNRVTQIKSEKPDGYRAVQVTFGSRKPSRIPKALAGHFAKGNDEARAPPRAWSSRSSSTESSGRPCNEAGATRRIRLPSEGKRQIRHCLSISARSRVNLRLPRPLANKKVA
jgi:hypothetical protein